MLIIIISVAVGICLLSIILIFVAAFIVRKQKSHGINKHNTYIQPISEFDMTYISTIENDSNHTILTDQDSYQTIPTEHDSYQTILTEQDSYQTILTDQDVYNTIPTDQDSYHTIPDSHFDNTQEKCLYL